jgi:3-oxoacyl-[acyl-carrier protein] reductase
VNRRILITGTTRGLGRFLAEHYLSQGDIVIGCGRSAVTITHDNYVHHQLDVTSEPALSGVFADIRRRFDGIDVLINNAGAASMNAFALTPLALVRRVVETNFIGTAMLTHGAIRLLRRASAGRIVNLTSIAVPLRLEGEAVYAASKSAIETFTRILAREIGPMGITCNAVGPSVIRTQLTGGVPPEKLERLIQGQAVKREATAADVANVTDFFLRPESGLVTGQIVYLGGYG